jgi:hypothetical protein
MEEEARNLIFCTGTHQSPSGCPWDIGMLLSTLTINRRRLYAVSTEAQMRISAREVLFTGQDRCPEFDPCREPLPKKLNVLLCLIDGAERRRKLQAKLNKETTATTSSERYAKPHG